MQILVVTSSARTAATRAMVDSLRRHHRDATVTLLVADPRHRTGGADPGVVVATDLTIDGLRYVDVWMGGGPAFARWAAVPAAVRALQSDGPVVVLPDCAWVRGDIAALTHAVAPGE